MNTASTARRDAHADSPSRASAADRYAGLRPAPPQDAINLAYAIPLGLLCWAPILFLWFQLGGAS